MEPKGVDAVGVDGTRHVPMAGYDKMTGSPIPRLYQQNDLHNHRHLTQQSAEYHYSPQTSTTYAPQNTTQVYAPTANITNIQQTGVTAQDMQ